VYDKDSERAQAVRRIPYARIASLDELPAEPMRQRGVPTLSMQRLAAG